MRLKITHRTEYSYDTPVSYALQRLRLVPGSGPTQTVRSWELQIEGAKEEVHFRDQFANDTRLVSDPNAHPIWARFYDLEEGRPYVCDRDGVPKRRLEEIGHERRNGYSWYNNRPAALYARYAKWAARHDPERKVAVSLDKKL